MFGFSVVVMAALYGLWWYAMRRDPGEISDQQAQRHQNRWVIWGGLALPIGSITLLLAFGIPAGHRMLPLPPAEGEALVIEVKAHQWFWQVRYPERDIELINALVIPANTPVDIHLTTADVIHSFWVPRLGGKLDTIPGRTNVLRLEADRTGDFHGQCAEFCGAGHAHMPFVVTAKSAEDYQQWLNNPDARTQGDRDD